MGISTQRVKLDINKQASMQVIRLGQGDRNGTTLIAELYDGGSQYSLSGKTARFVMRTPDRQSSYSVNSSSTSSNTATFNIDERYAAGVAGTTDVAYIEVLSGSTAICSTSRMRVICLQSATEGVSPSQMHDNGLDAAIAAANTAASSANTAASNANTKASRAETATTNANTARDNANSAASAANAAASAATTAAGNANSAAEAANSAKDAANAAASAANTAADNANAATSEANAAIEAIGDISELAVPEMTANVRGGAKVGGSTQVIGGKLEVKLSESATGTSITTGSTSALRELQVHGKSVQDGTPTPSEPVDIQVVKGRNLFPKPTVRTITSNNVTYTVASDGLVTVNGTASATTRFSLYSGVSFNIPAGTYTMSKTAGSTVRIYFGGNTDTAHVTKTLTDAVDQSVFQIQVGNGASVNESFYVQLEEGSTATPYVPYGSIGIVVGDTATPIDLQGNVLASLPDGTRDELHVDSAGRVWIESISWRGTIASVGTVNTSGSTYYAVITPTDASGKRDWSSVAEFSSQPGTPRAWCSKCTSDGTGIFVARTWNGIYAYAPASLGLTQEDFDKLVGAEFIMKNRTATIDLGYIDPPTIPSGSVVTVSASLTPTFDLDCWTEHASELADTTATLANEINSLRAQIAALATS